MKNMRKIIASWVAIVMAVVGIPFSAAALDHADGWEYVYISKNQVKIVGHTQDLQGKVELPAVVDGRQVVAIGKSAFYGCEFLTSVTLPKSVTSIEANAFEGCIRLQKIVLPEILISLGDRAFYGCVALENLHIPAGVTTIGSQVYGACSDKIHITVADENPTYTAVDDVLYDKAMKKLICCRVGKAGEEFTVPEGVTVIGTSAFEDCQFHRIILPDSLITIEKRAFRICQNLTEIKIPQNVVTVEESAFHDCFALETVTFTNGNITFGFTVFSNCQSLQQITIPEGVTTISYGMFLDCCALTHVTLPDSLTTIKAGAFAYCSSLKHIILPKNITTIEPDIFQDCSKITVSIPMNTTEIGSHIFGIHPIAVKIRGYRGSYAQLYAEGYRCADGKVTFEPIDYDLVDGSEYQLPVGQILDFNLPDLPDGQTVKWQSSDETIARVSEGIVTAVGGGHAVITAQYTVEGKEHTVSCKVKCFTAALGDVNRDGNINAYDALLVLQTAVGKLTLTPVQMDLADWNCDGRVDAVDALQILRNAVTTVD